MIVKVSIPYLTRILFFKTLRSIFYIEKQEKLLIKKFSI